MLQYGAFHIALSHSQRTFTIAFLLPGAHMTTRGDLAEKLVCTSTSLRNAVSEYICVRTRRLPLRNFLALSTEVCAMIGSMTQVI